MMPTGDLEGYSVPFSLSEKCRMLDPLMPARFPPVTWLSSFLIWQGWHFYHPVGFPLILGLESQTPELASLWATAPGLCGPGLSFPAGLMAGAGREGSAREGDY